MMRGLGTDDTPYLNNPWCPGCGGRLVHPGDMGDYQAQDAMDGAYAVHCRACGLDFISYDGDDGVDCEECGSRETEPSQADPIDLLQPDEEQDNEKYVCPSCDSEWDEDEVRMMFPVDASALGPYTQQMASARYFIHAWKHDLPLPQRIQMVQEMLMLIHDAGPLFNRFFGASGRDSTVQVMRFLDLLSGNDLSKWRDPSYLNQRLRTPWQK